MSGKYKIFDASGNHVNTIKAEAESIAAFVPDGGSYEAIDTPSEAEVALAAWRATATLSRAQFCVAVKRAGILTGDEAIEAAKGEWPAAFDAVLEGTDIDPDEAKIVWASVSTIFRNDTILEAVSEAVGLSAEDVDAMFGAE